MDKKKLFDHLTTLKIKEETNAEDDYKTLKQRGIEYAFKYLTEQEAVFVSKYLIRYPHIYYNRYIDWVLGVKPIYKIKDYTEEIRNTIWEYHKYFYHQYVGTFFYIGGKLKGLKTDLSSGNIKADFIDSPVSHFDYFSFLGIDDDYGHYPRGRVIYNNRTNEFYLCIDKDYKKNKKVIEEVMKVFNLCSYNTIVKTDEHYTHDNL